MSLFGTYISDYINESNDDGLDLAIEGVVGNPEFDIVESSNEIAFLSGSIFGEASVFEALTGVSESIDYVVEAANGRFAKIKEKFLAFIDKVVQFFADLNAKLQAKVFTVIAKMNKNGVFKKNVKIYDVSKDKEYNEMMNKVYAALGKLEHSGTNPSKDQISDILEDRDSFDLKFDDAHVAKCSTEIVKGTKVGSAIQILDKGKNIIKTNNDTIKRCKAIQKQFVKLADTTNKANTDADDLDFDAAALNTYAKTAVAIINAATDAARKVNAEMYRNAVKIGSASAFKGGETSDQAKIEAK